MIKLSVAIITYNEEKNIGRCISSLLEVADEILVVDSFSTDKTEDICKSFGARFIQNKFMGYIEQKNFALDQCTHSYVLSLDADEALSENLINEIKTLKKNFQSDGYCFNRLNNYNGHWVRFGGWYPDTKLRLVNKIKARWTGVNPHDFLKMINDEKPAFIKGDLYHYSYESITAHIGQTNKFTSIAAEALFAKGVKSGFFKMVIRPPLTFLRDYILKKGFLDGRYGFIICSINAFSTFLKYSKLRDLELGKKI